MLNFCFHELIGFIEFRRFSLLMLNFCFHELIGFIEFRRFSAILASLMALVAPSLHIHNSQGKQKVTSEERFFPR